MQPHGILRRLLAHPSLSMDTILTELSCQITIYYIASPISGLHTIARVIMNSVFWVVASCCLVDGYQGFRRTRCLLFQGRRTEMGREEYSHVFMTQ